MNRSTKTKRGVVIIFACWCRLKTGLNIDEKGECTSMGTAMKIIQDDSLRALEEAVGFEEVQRWRAMCDRLLGS